MRAVEAAIRRAIRIDAVRDLDRDPSYCVDELRNVAWTAISSAKHNPQPGELVLVALRDLLVRWAARDDEPCRSEPLPVVYRHDPVRAVIEAYADLGVAAVESKQSSTLAVAIDALSTARSRLRSPYGDEVDELLERFGSFADDLPPTLRLDGALARL